MTLTTTPRLAMMITLVLILAACGSPANNPQAPANQVATEPAPTVAPGVAVEASVIAPVLDLTSAPPAALPTGNPALDLNNLPDVPLVSFPGSDWFQPTPASQIQMVSGKVQLFDFSAVW